MLHFEGVREFALPPQALFARLSDAAFLVTCIPDASIQGQPTKEEAVCSVKPGLSFVGGTMEVTIRVVEATSPSALKFQLNSKGIGSSSQVETNLTVAPTAAGSRVEWKTDVVSLGGLLKVVPAGLIRGAAQKTIEDIWNGIAQRVEASGAAQSNG